MSELLKEVQVDYSPQFSKLVDDTVSSIKSSIDKIPKNYKVIILSIFFHYLLLLLKHSILIVLNARWLNLQVTADLAPSFVRDIGADKVEFKFKKPSVFKFGGSYSIQSVARPELNVDLIIRLPKVLFI